MDASGMIGSTGGMSYAVNSELLPYLYSYRYYAGGTSPPTTSNSGIKRTMTGITDGTSNTVMLFQFHWVHPD
jgi:hypothetical protein